MTNKLLKNSYKAFTIQEDHKTIKEWVENMWPKEDQDSKKEIQKKIEAGKRQWEEEFKDEEERAKKEQK